MSPRRFCFVVMPFRPELNFLFLYLQKYLAEKHGVRVERGDQHVLTKALMEKIRDQIIAADAVIADITGGNANVFYEIGLAHAFNKPVIFLTQDSPQSAPVDVRQFEFIQYDLGHHQELLGKLDNAIQNVFIERYRVLHDKALDLLGQFNAVTNSSYPAASLEEFQARIMRSEQVQDIALLISVEQQAEFLLPKILQDATDVTMMRKVMDWTASFAKSSMLTGGI